MMNSGSSTLKVTVNGKKYLITGIQRETSCKGLLCAIAKVTSQEEEAHYKQYSVTRGDSRPNENLLERFKGDRQLAGDLTSLNVFNSLARDAKIIAKETITVRKEVIVDKSAQVQNSSTAAHKHNKHSKKQKSGKETRTKEEKKEKKSKQKAKKKKETFTSTTTTTLTTTRETKVKHKIKHRSVDDSDIEIYRRDGLKRMKQKRRVYDDSDIEIYRNLEEVVVDQSKKLRRLQKNTREVKRSAWMKELSRNSQIYYIDDEPPTKTDLTVPVEVEAENCVYEKDDGNDSGLPSPEYDSSESQDIQPIKLEEALLLANNNTRYQITKDESKQTSLLSKENNENVKQSSELDISPNAAVSARNVNNNVNSSNSTTECISTTKAGLLNSETVEEKNGCVGNISGEQNELEGEITTIVHGSTNGLPDLENEKDTLQMLTLNRMVCATKEDQVIQSTTVDGDNTSALLLIKKENYKNAMIDKNKNILIDSETCEHKINKMVAFNEALFKGSTTVNGSASTKLSKVDKKKFKKSDISDPVLLSPATLKKHQSVRKVQSVLGQQAADVLRKDVLKSMNGNPPSLNETKTGGITKEKEKYFNKKLKEIRSKTSSKKSSSKTTGKDSGKSSKNEPEYFPKMESTDKQRRDDITNVTTKLPPAISELQKDIEVNNYKHSNTDERNHESDIESINSIEITSNCSEDSHPSNNTQSKQIDMLETKSTTSEISETVLTADEILNDILEYERNIKNELDQLIQCEEEEEKDESKGDENSKKTMINKANNSLTVDKHETGEHKINFDINKQTNNIITTASENISLENSTTSQSNQKGPSESMKDVTDSMVGLNAEEQERFELIEKYLEEKQALDEISSKLSDYNYALSRLQENIDLYDLEMQEQKTLQELQLEEQDTGREIENFRSLLKSVADLTAYQRKEMSENTEIMDQIDLDVRTQKANYENLRNGTWKNNSKSAPRSLIKNVKVKRRNSLLNAFDSSQSEHRNSSSFV